MTYDELLAGAPAHDSIEFIQYLRNNNPIVFENPQWLVIKNFKYNTPERAWYTAFHKPYTIGDYRSEWWQDVDILWYQGWQDWTWLKKPASEQTVKRFHIHIHQ